MYDPVAFISDCVEFPAGQGLTPYQAEVIAMLPEARKVGVRGPHGLGKSTMAALLLHWFALTRDAACARGDFKDWKCPITAGAWRQLEQFLWPEIHAWSRRIRWDRVGREPYNNRTELLRLQMHLDYGGAFAMAATDPAKIEGAHADSIMVIFDEAKAIQEATFNAAAGALSGAGSGGREGYALVSSTPGEPLGRFYDIHMQKPGFKYLPDRKAGWWVRHVTLEEALEAERINPEWVEEHRAMWGEESQLFFNRVLGEFHASDVDAIVPLPWFEKAVERWYENESYRTATLDRVGVDVARSGDDRTVIAAVHGFRVAELLYSFHEDTTKTEQRVYAAAAGSGDSVIIVDADGVGAGVFDHVKEKLGFDRVKPFHAAAATNWRDKSGELEFLNTRAAAWWNLRQMLDPANNPTLELPDDEQLMGDLIAPRKRESQRGKIQVESKDDLRRRLNRSTDSADAVVMAMWTPKKRRRRRMGNMGFGESPEPQNGSVPIQSVQAV